MQRETLNKGSLPNVIVVGDALVDILIPLEQFDAEYGRSEIERFVPKVSGGGTSGNTAVALAKLGTNISFLGTVGSDFGGRFVLDEFNNTGVDSSLVITDAKYNTISVYAFIQKNGERILWGFPTVDPAYAQLDLDKVDMNRIKKAKWIHSSGMNFTLDGPMRQSLPRLFKEAYESGVTTSFDLNTRCGDPKDLDPGVEKAVRETLPYVNYLLGSAKDEFYSFAPSKDWKDSVRSFVTETRTAISRMGSEGAFVVSKREEFSLRPYKVKVVDTVGAGDAFNAGFISSMVAGNNLYQSVINGNAVASYKVSGSGGRSTPTVQQLKEFYKKYININKQ